MLTPDYFNKAGSDGLTGLLGIVITEVREGEIRAELDVKPNLMAANGFLHAGTVVSLADTCGGCGCFSSLPEGATGFTTIELKSNHLGTARGGVLECTAKAVHFGKSTQVWDSTVVHRDSGKTIALFRCTQMILYPAVPKATQ